MLAHEYGHHIQQQLGIEQKVRAESQSNPDDANELSVRLELQADCFAGLWGRSVYQAGILEDGDLEEGITAAEAVGDDRIQEQTQGRIDPEIFTHGTSEQRRTWFRKGFDSGDIEQCDTFCGRRGLGLGAERKEAAGLSRRPLSTTSPSSRQPRVPLVVPAVRAESREPVPRVLAEFESSVDWPVVTRVVSAVRAESLVPVPLVRFELASSVESFVLRVVPVVSAESREPVPVVSEEALELSVPPPGPLLSSSSSSPS